MATWALTAQLTTGTLAVGTTDRVWFNGANYGDNVVVGAYQDSTHITNSADTHQCTTNHVNNTKYASSTTVVINGAGAATLGGSVPTQAQAPLLFNFQDVSVATNTGRFYAYDGTTDANPMAGVTFQAIEAIQSTTWTSANGSGSALVLQNQSPAVSHNFYIGTSVSPTSTGAKTGKIKITLTYV